MGVVRVMVGMAPAAQQATLNANVNESDSEMIPMVTWGGEMVGKRMVGNFSEPVVRQRIGMVGRTITNTSGTISAVWGGVWEATQ